MKAILAVAVLAMAAFAGVMIVGDDADAAVPTYKVTYKFGESVIVDKTSAETEGQYSFTKTPSAMGFAAPTGYAFDLTKWKDANSGAIYSISADSSVKYTFSADVVVEPIIDVANDKAVIVLTDGNVSEKFILSTPYKMTADTPGFADCLKALGLKADSTGNIVIDKTGFRFDGFYLADSTTPIKTIAGLDGGAGKEITFTAKYTPVYDISFVVEDVNIITLASDKLADKTGKYIIPVAPTKENHVFTAWVDKDGKNVITYTADGGYKPVASELEFTENTVLYAAFTPDNMTVTFQIGEKTVTQTVLYGAKAMKPELPAGYVAWMYDGKEFDFNNTPILENITIVALEAGPVEPTTIYDITFEIADKTPVVQKSDSMVIPDTTLDGYIFQGWVVKNGSQYVDPVEYVKTITDNVTFVAVYKLATESAFTVTFEIEGKSAITQKADSLAIPDTTREGYDFTGWVVKGSSDYVDPMTYLITADITFVAVYKAVEVVEYTVTFVNGDEVIDTIKVISGAVVEEINAPEGMFWLFDFDTAIIADLTVEAKPLTVTVQFAVGEKVYNAYTQTIAYGEKIDTAKLADFIFPAGYDSWDCDFNEPIISDMTVFAKAIPEPEEVPPFFKTTEGKCVAVLIAVVIIALVYAVYSNMFGLRDALTSVKITRVKK